MKLRFLANGHMRLEFDTKAAAQSKADAIHAWLVANNKDYAASVASGQTLRWAEPRQDLDRDGKPIGTKWHVSIKDRCLNALSTQEKNAIK
jgi:hypothetical protein